MNAGRDLYERQCQPFEDHPDHPPHDPETTYASGIAKPRVAKATPGLAVGREEYGITSLARLSSFYDEHNHSEWVPCVPALCDYAANERTRMRQTDSIGPAHPAYEDEADNHSTEFEGRIYISGPMRGMESLNQAAFNSLAVTLRRNGWVVHNPHDTPSSERHFNGEEVTYAEAIREDIGLLMDSTAIILLPGWSNSEGARFEVAIAHALGLQFYEANVIEGNGTQAWEWLPIDNPNIVAEGVDQEARRLVYGDRAATYGHPKGDFQSIGEVWTSLINKHFGERAGVNMPVIPPELVAIMMSGLKLVRLAASPDHRDSKVDAIGYILCEDRVLESPVEIAAWNARALNGDNT